MADPDDVAMMNLRRKPETPQMAIESAMRLFAAAETRMKSLRIRRNAAGPA